MRRAVFALFAASLAVAHVGSPDVFFEGKAGNYPVYVTIRPPAVIPGVAEIEVRAATPDVKEVFITPTPLTGPGAKFAPTPDRAKQSPQDAQYFTGSLWMMSAGSWQVKLIVNGSQGRAELNVPVPNAAKRTMGMDTALTVSLAALMVFLVVGMISIVGAAAREAQLEPGLEPQAPQRRRGRIAMVAASVLVGLMLWGGNSWWTAEAKAYDRYLYKPIGMKAAVAEGKLQLDFEHQGWLQSEKFDDLIPDHGYLMHLFVVSLPNLDRVWHLHPEMRANGRFEKALPSMPAGKYQLYADIVHRNGFPETLVAEIDLAEQKGVTLTGDDVAGALSPGLKMVFENANESIQAKKLTPLRFHLENEKGEVVKDIELYLGMPGHAAVLKKDRKVFAHLHPSGTTPMASLELAAQNLLDRNPHAVHQLHAMHAALPATVSFPFGFPVAGDYRIFVQMKRAGKVETGSFDLTVRP